jgi:hypothetical protein
METFPKAASAKLDFGFDFLTLGWLATGETITASTWTIPTGITKVSDAFSSTATVVWISGGTLGASYQITNHITTSAGREDDRSILIKITTR